MSMTIEEIKEQFDDEFYEEGAGYGRSVFNNVFSDEGKFLCEYGDDDEFIVDSDRDHYCPKDKWEELYFDYAKAVAYLEDRKFMSNFQDYIGIDSFIRMGNIPAFTQTTLKKALIEYISDDVDDYLNFVWDEEAKEKRTSAKKG